MFPKKQFKFRIFFCCGRYYSDNSGVSDATVRATKLYQEAVVSVIRNVTLSERHNRWYCFEL